MMNELIEVGTNYNNQNAFDTTTLKHHRYDMDNVPITHTLDDLAEQLHIIFGYDTVDVDCVINLLRNYKPNVKDWSRYAKFDPYKYTRNLIDKGNGKFNLILLCWSESQGSSIHDHSNSHCFVKLLDGELCETLYEWPKDNESDMMEKKKTVYKKNEVSYINDTIGLHRVENPSHSKPAVSLHIYIPPFEECNTFDIKSGKKRVCKITFFSVDGNKINYCTE